MVRENTARKDDEMPSAETRGALIGRRIKLARESKRPKMTQDDLRLALAERTGQRPKTIQAISKWEAGKREEFYQFELDALAEILGVPCDFFTSEEENRFQSVESLSQDIDKTSAQAHALALVTFADIMSGDKMLDTAIADSLRHGRVYKTAFPLPYDGFCFPCNDNSNAPMLVEATVASGNCLSGSMLSIARRVLPEPDDFLLVRIGREVLLRRYQFEGEQVLLVPVNPRWRTLRFSVEEWQESVEIIGVLASYENRTRALKVNPNTTH